MAGGCAHKHTGMHMVLLEVTRSVQSQLSGDASESVSESDS